MRHKTNIVNDNFWTAIFVTVFLIILAYSCQAQDSTNIVTSVAISSKNVWRGNVYGNNKPSISTALGYKVKGLETGIVSTAPLDGSRDGFGIWAELYASYTIKKFTFTIDDYYYFNAQDSLNDYFNWKRGETQHYVESRVRYDQGRWNATGSYVLYANAQSVNSLYLESEFYLLPKLLSLTVGYVFGRSDLAFYDKGGITHVSVTAYKQVLKRIPSHFAVIVSPNYRNAQKYPAFTQNPINVVVGVVF
jgi:hypothetical protein